MEKGNKGTAFPGVHGMDPPLRGGKGWYMGGDVAGGLRLGDVSSHECWMSVHRVSQSIEMLRRGCLPSLGLSLHHTTVPALLQGKEKPWRLLGHGETLSSQGLPQALPSQQLNT